MSTVTIGRTALFENWKTQTRVTGASLTINGQESTPPLGHGTFRALMHNLIAMEQRVVPITFTDKESLNGYYFVESVDVNYTNWHGVEEVADWAVKATRLGDEGFVQQQTVLSSLERTNSHSITGTTWHAAPVGTYAYEAGATEPSTLTRTTADGSLTVLLGVAESPTWSVAPEDFYKGAATILRPYDDHVYEGLNFSLDVEDWQISNGLLRVSPASSNPGRLQLDYYKSGWQSGETLALAAPTTMDTAWSAGTVIRNTPEQVTIRLERPKSTGVGKVIVDLTLMRGSRLVHGYMQSTSSENLKIQTGQSGNTVTSGYMVASSGTDRWIIGTAGAVDTNDTTTGEIARTSVTSFDFYAGYIPDYSSAPSGETADDLAAQYVGAPAVSDRALRR